ncbi:hypothetical protein ACVXHB_07200 [Escherichia coli]
MKQKLSFVALLVLAVAWPFMVSRWDGGYRHSDHEIAYPGLGLNVVVRLFWSARCWGTAVYAIGAYTLRCSITITAWASGLVCHCRVNGSGGGLPARLSRCCVCVVIIWQ